MTDSDTADTKSLKVFYMKCFSHILDIRCYQYDQLVTNMDILSLASVSSLAERIAWQHITLLADDDTLTKLL